MGHFNVPQENEIELLQFLILFYIMVYRYYHGQKLSRWRSGLSIGIHVYIYIYIVDRVGHWESFLLLIPGKTYKLGTSETCDVIGHGLFIYEIYLKYTFG